MAYLMADVLEALELDVPQQIPSHISCPVHDDSTPSLWVQQSRWWCFGCGVGGDGIDFVRFLTGASWGQAKQFLAGLGDVDLPEHAQPERVLPDLTDRFNDETSRPLAYSMAEAKEFVAERWPHLSLGQLMDWGIGIGRNHLWIPHRDAEGIVRGIKLRTFSGARRGDKSAIPGSVFTTRLYRVEDKPDADFALLSEGESDCWTNTATSTGAVFALPSGANCWNSSFVEELKAYGSVLVALDNDDTGRRAAERIVGVLRSAGCRYVDPITAPGPGKDWTDDAVATWRRTHG